MPRNTAAQLLKPKMSKPRKKIPAIHRGKPFTINDPLRTIVGLGKSGGLADVSENKDKYLADAYDSKKA